MDMFGCFCLCSQKEVSNHSLQKGKSFSSSASAPIDSHFQGYDEKVKILLIGSQGVGNSTILQKLKYGNASDKQRKKQKGLDYEKINYLIEGKKVRSVIFDIPIREKNQKPLDKVIKQCHAIIYLCSKNDKQSLEILKNQVEKIKQSQKHNNEILKSYFESTYKENYISNTSTDEELSNSREEMIENQIQNNSQQKAQQSSSSDCVLPQFIIENKADCDRTQFGINEHDLQDFSNYLDAPLYQISALSKCKELHKVIEQISSEALKYKKTLKQQKKYKDITNLFVKYQSTSMILEVTDECSSGTSTWYTKNGLLPCRH